MEEYKPKYSGPNKSGICKCEHSWDAHHLGLVAKTEYINQTNEYYIPGECLHYGNNEAGGLMLDDKGDWVEHCFGYKDKLDE